MEENVVAISKQDGCYKVVHNEEMIGFGWYNLPSVAMYFAKREAKRHNAKLTVAWDIAPIE